MTVVVLSGIGAFDRGCLESISVACSNLRAEIIVVDASHDQTAEIVRGRWPSVTVLRYPPGTLVPVLWGAGLAAARGRSVAFTIGHMIVSPQWAAAFVGELLSADGVGGPIVLDDDSGPVDWAVFFLRYSAFLPAQLASGPAMEIAGDNAAYSRAALMEFTRIERDGFWEVEFHHHLRARRGRLVACRHAIATFTRSAPLGTVVRHRFAHAVRFGATRVASGLHPLRIVAAAPLVPAALAVRAGRRAIRSPHPYLSRFILSLPAFLLVASVWAAGEAVGAVARKGPVQPWDAE